MSQFIQISGLPTYTWDWRLILDVNDLNLSLAYIGVTYYGKCSKISNTYPFLFSKKLLAISVGIHKMLVRIANREDPDQTASEEAVWSESALFV